MKRWWPPFPGMGPVDVEEEVGRALTAGLPVVALESTLVAHGLPWPDNLRVARAMEEAVRESDAVPATVAVLGGRVCIGLSPPHLEALASRGAEIQKVGASDLAVVLARGADAATTVSATGFLAARIGIRVFATGGIGGVHRDDPDDVSQDLTALARTPIAVVSAGAKSILDLPRTLEALETLGVLVVGVGTDELPAFYVRRSGIPLEHRVDSVAEAASVMAHRFETLEQGGILFCNPISEELGLDAGTVEAAVTAAMARASERGVRGKAVTPFLLEEMARSTRGATIRANQALAVSNARFAGRLARAWHARTG